MDYEDEFMWVTGFALVVAAASVAVALWIVFEVFR